MTIAHRNDLREKLRQQFFFAMVYISAAGFLCQESQNPSEKCPKIG
jgi:hypothetical protein